MESSNTSGSTSNANLTNIAPKNAQSQLLLKALWNVVTPLVQAAGHYEKIDMDEALLLLGGSEAEELLTALQNYVSCIIRAHSGQLQNRIKVELDPAGNAEYDNQEPRADLVIEGVRKSLGDIEKWLDYLSIEGDEEKSDSDCGTVVNSFSAVGDAISIGIEDFEQVQSKRSSIRVRLLDKLREHVFNNMPIRLLCFETDGSEIGITLLERGDIYIHLAQKLLEDFDEISLLELLSDSAASKYKDPNVAEEKAIHKRVQQHAKYAILSHTWLRGAWNEVTYTDWNEGAFDTSQPGYQKLVNFCKAAAASARHMFTLGWMDTVCINKDSSSELDESIRSMYQWYRQADLCIIYLAQTSELSQIREDPWFTRGWTLQELLAPRHAKFYNKVWEELGDRASGVGSGSDDEKDEKVLKQIELASTITAQEMIRPWEVPISRKMQWAARREVTREEDIAYSLMGIFDVSMSIAYGEGVQRAFLRLLKKILNSSPHVLDLLNWGGKDPWRGPSSLLPSSLQFYCHRVSHPQLYPRLPVEPLMLTHLGLRIPVILMPAKSTEVVISQYNSIGAYYATVQINPTRSQYTRDIPEIYKVLEKRDPKFKGDSWSPDGSIFQMTLGILNFGGDEARIQIPKICLAVGLRYYDDGGKAKPLGDIAKIATHEPIVFGLHSRIYRTEGIGKTYVIERSEATKQGMQVVTLYL